ncbi:hypothetical protein AWV63_12720 [Micromonospora rifamycinica]|uniref:Uncharacterized protein n=1 Tax=Micromonospora rifamycinica TaxID=291594 RepID=A0A109IKQ5_9ACTN|nr:hypothetical protein AWV63_12720 [Micromonospora rifamycinica]SCG46497.1 hypothetical protein GA0070623_1369 [Micromonospora rifamycinica]
MPSAMHRLLLRIAGQAPAVLLGTARARLADGAVTEVARMVAFAAVARQIRLTDPDVLLLSRVLVAAGAAADLLADLPRAGDDRTPPYLWTPDPPADPGPPGSALSGVHPPVGDVASGGVDEVDRAVVDEVDRAVVDALGGGEEQPAGLWRAWRRPAPATPYPPATRVYLVQARAGAVALTARLQAALVAVGETAPLVEVFGHLAGLPAYHRRALAGAVLLWAARPAERVRVAATFDTLDATGNPTFGPDRPRLSNTEANRVAGYLAAGFPLLTGPAQVPDVVTPGRTVPVDLLGDGRWIWSAATAHYLTRYRIAPDEGLLAAIRAAGYAPPDVDAVAVHRSRATLVEATGAVRRTAG